MPSIETLERFIAMVEQNDHVQACETFYAIDSRMRENQAEPRVGRAAHVLREREVMARARSVASTCVRPAFVDGDQVAIRWIFRFEWLDGSVTHMEEVAWQRWRGELIADETFFYDPAQHMPESRRY